MDIAFIKQYIPMYVEAGKLTLGIAFLGILFSLLIGFAASLILYYKVPLWRRVVQIYVELSRNTPLLVQLFFPDRQQMIRKVYLNYLYVQISTPL